MKIIKEQDQDSAQIASSYLKEGRVICLATDTVYGLACDASNQHAVEKIYQIKRRSKDKPIAIFVKDLPSAEKIFVFDSLAKKIANQYLEGPLTMILKTHNKNNLAKNLSQKQDGFLGFRIVNTNFINDLMAKFDGNLAVTSANFSNQQEIYNAQMAEKTFLNQGLDLLIDGGTLEKKPCSTIVKISDNQLTILRQGNLKISHGQTNY